MAAGLGSSYNENQKTRRLHGAWLLIFLTLTLFQCCAAGSNRLIGFRPIEKYNGIDDNGVFNILTGTTVTLLLFGDGITNNTFIKFTDSSSSCDERDPGVERVGGDYAALYPPGDNSTDNSQYSLTFNNLPVKEQRTFYFCVDFNGSDDNDNFEHQGSEKYLRLIVQIEILPLAVEIIFIIALMILSGLFSGLNLGLMALDPTTLKIIKQSGTKRQRAYANLIFRVRRHGNYLLCTLLLGNVIVNSTLTILLDNVLPGGVYAVIASTLSIVIFGEIIPQAICSRHGLIIGAWTIPLTLSFMVLTFPLSFPLSLILNLILGKEVGAVYNRDQLLKLLDVTQDHHDLVEDEVKIISGVLAYKEKLAEKVMTKFEDVYFVSVESVLDFKLMREIYDSGFSRIPIYEGERNNIVGLLYVRDLAFVDPDDQTTVHAHMEFYKHELQFVWNDTKLGELMKVFVSGKCHIAIVQKVNNETEGDPFYENIGVVTLEDILEEILQQEIVDETDRFIDNESKILHKRKNFDVAEFDKSSPEDLLTSQQKLAVFQFLSTVVEPFQKKLISDNVLKRLLSKNVVQKISLEDSKRTNLQLYTMGTEASFFMFILEGCMDVQIGKEGLTFESKSFSCFGAQALLNATLDPPVEYIPDYTVRPTTDCIVIIITKRQYLAAIEATQFEGERTGAASEAVAKKPKQDVFAKEWELAEDQDLQDSASVGLSSITKFLTKKHVNPHAKSSDKRHLLTESSEESEENSPSLPHQHKPVVETHSVGVLEDRFHWLSMSQNGESSRVSHSDADANLTELHVVPSVQDRNSDSGHRTSADREDWALNTSSEV